MNNNDVMMTMQRQRHDKDIIYAHTQPINKQHVDIHTNMYTQTNMEMYGTK